MGCCENPGSKATVLLFAARRERNSGRTAEKSVTGPKEQDMKAAKTFDPRTTLEAAKAGQLKGATLRKAIKRAEDLGMKTVVRELQLYLVSADAFAGDDAPPEVRERFTQGVSALTAMGHTLSRTRQMFLTRFIRKHGRLNG